MIGKYIEACCKPRQAHKTLILFGSVPLFSELRMFQLGVMEPLTLCLFILPSGSTSGRSGIWACSTMPWFLNDSLVPTAKRSGITISTYLATHLWKQDLSSTRDEVVLNALVCNIALSKYVPYVHIWWVFTVYCVSVCLLAVRFHIRKENSSMKMNLKRKGIRYNKLLVWLGFFTFKYAIRKHHGAK